MHKHAGPSKHANIFLATYALLKIIEAERMLLRKEGNTTLGHRAAVPRIATGSVAHSSERTNPNQKSRRRKNGKSTSLWRSVHASSRRRPGHDCRSRRPSSCTGERADYAGPT